MAKIKVHELMKIRTGAKDILNFLGKRVRAKRRHRALEEDAALV